MILHKTRNPEFFSLCFTYILSPVNLKMDYRHMEQAGYQGFLPDLKLHNFKLCNLNLI